MAVVNLGEFRQKGHATVPGVFAAGEMDAAIGDIERWGEEFLRELPPEQRHWYLEPGVKARQVLRKLDNPHYHREAFRRIARDPRLVGLVESIIGPGVSFHHGTVFHQSGPNRSRHWRRACALHYVRNGNRFVKPALPYDESLFMRIT